jgi:hypothetical protein
VYDFLLFVHVLFAFGLVAAMTTFWAMILSTRPERMSLTPAGAMLLGRACAILVGISSLGVVVFGVWLAIYLDSYELWDGWIIGSLILWAIGTGAGQRSGAYYQRASTASAEAVPLRRTGLQLQVLSSAAILLILVLMIFKPGA